MASTTRWQLTESVLKGVYLGLLMFVAAQAKTASGAAAALLWGYAGLIIALLVAAWQKLQAGVRVRGRVTAFVLFLLLESPGLVYGGILLGMLAAALWPGQGDQFLTTTTLVGLGLGLLLGFLPRIRHRWLRFAAGLALAAALAAGTLAGLYFWRGSEFLNDDLARAPFGAGLLVGLPLFYLLTFAGVSEDTEGEIALFCATLAVAGFMLSSTGQVPQSLALLLPVLLYLVYTARVLPRLKVFKYALRGVSYASIGERRRAILAFRRALQLDPTSRLAQEGLWNVHRSADLAEMLQDPETLAVVDLDLCLDRATSLLLQAKPRAAELAEANRLLDLVLHQRPAARPRIDYWKAVADTHAGLLERAAERLEYVLDAGNFPSGDPERANVLFSAWQLALTLHSELKRRVGLPQLSLPGRRMEAIAAVERRLAALPEDAEAWELKRLLYSELTEAEYKAAAGPDRAAVDFDHAYTEQLGAALLADAARRQRGVEYLRLAARGQPQRAPALFIQIALVHEHAGQPEAVWDYYELAKRAGRAFGHKNLDEKERQDYFAVVKLLAEHARNTGNLDQAIENYQLYTEFERSGLETLRTLAQLHEEKGDALAALRITEQALVYNPKDKELLARKDRYYYSVAPEQLKARLDSFGRGFDVDYCLTKARSLLDYKNADMEVIDWAEHLAALAAVVRPESLAAKVLRARALRRRGESEAAQALLQEAYQQRAEKYSSNAEEDAWYVACRLLGEIYLYEAGRPDLAVPCFQDFRKSSKSGADTLFKLGQAYEQLGDRDRAKRYYEHVISFEGHPLTPDAREAIYRMQSS